MKINHTGRNIIFMLSACFVAFLAGCKKDDKGANILPSPAIESMHLTNDFSISRIVHGQMRMGDWKKVGPRAVSLHG